MAHTRQPITPDELAERKWALTKACIDLAIRDAVLETGTDRCLHGSPDSGYWFALDHARDVPHQPDLVPEDLRPAMVHYRLPPVTRSRASAEPAVMEDYLGDPCLLYTSPSPRDGLLSRMPSSA